MADPGTIIAGVTIAYKVAIKAWAAFQTALDFDDESANQVVRLEIEKFRFQTWALNCGLTTGTFDVNLHPIYELIAERLSRITKLFDNAEQVKDSFGLILTEVTKVRPDRSHGVMSGVASSIRAMGIKLDIDEQPKESGGKNVQKRIRWALSSKAKFAKLVDTAEGYIDKLDGLLTETQRKSASDTWKQINIVMVGNIAGDQVELVQQALRSGTAAEPSTSMSSIDSLIERKAIQAPRVIRRQGATCLERRNLEDFVAPEDTKGRNRIVAIPKEPLQSILGPWTYLLERKQYEPDISLQDKRLLKARLDRLILLLGSPRSDDFRHLQCVGYCDEPGSFSWWLIFEVGFTLPPMMNTISLKVLSLHKLFAMKHKPPLEERFMLANLLAKTLAELFNSGWMHKSIRSENILFPRTYEDAASSLKDMIVSLQSPSLAGFEYSRQDTEAVTIDKGKNLRDLSASIYRHPDYQGEAASGYKMKYDIYSFGLVLVEIALWTPLLIFLDAKVTKSSPNPTTLSSKMTSFHRDEALELRTRVLGRVDGELGFRVGSRYRDVVKWCLTMPDEEGTDGEEDWHPAFEFHNHVVRPLARCAEIVMGGNAGITVGSYDD